MTLSPAFRWPNEIVWKSTKTNPILYGVVSTGDDGDDDDFRRLRFFHTSAVFCFYFLFVEIEIEQNALHNGFTSFSGAKNKENIALKRNDARALKCVVVPRWQPADEQ